MPLVVVNTLPMPLPDPATVREWAASGSTVSPSPTELLTSSSGPIPLTT